MQNNNINWSNCKAKHCKYYHKIHNTKDNLSSCVYDGWCFNHSQFEPKSKK